MSNSADPIDTRASGASVPRLDFGIIIPALDKHGGAERFAIECIRRWQHHHDITLYSASLDSALLKESGIGDAVRLKQLSSPFEGEHSFVTNAVLLPKIWRQQIGRHDVYHVHLWPAHLVDLHPMVWFPHEPLRALYDLRYEQPSRGIERDVHMYPKFTYDQIDGNLYDAYLATANAIDKTVAPDVIVANSRYTADYLARVYRCEVPDVVYPGVDIEEPINLRIDPNLFVTISQLWSHKRISLLIEAIALTDGTQLIIAGSGPEHDYLMELCIKLGVEDRVFFLTGLSHFEIRLVLARACAFLFCPIREPFGIVVLEAMAAGKPIVAVEEGGYVEACHPDYTLFVPASPLAIAGKIAYLRDNPDLVRRMGAAARKAVQPFSWDRTAAELEQVLVRTHDDHVRHRSPRTSRDTSRTLVGIQYYLWYGDGFDAEHWNDNLSSGHVGDHPFLGYYASRSGRTIEHHLNEFEAMELDYVVLNLHIDAGGPNFIEMKSIQNLFEIAAERGSLLRFAVQIAAYGCDTATIASTVSTIENDYTGREEYFRLDGKPVLFWFWSTAHDGDAAFFHDMKRATAAFRNLAFGLRLPKGVDENAVSFGFFEGFAPYSPLELAADTNWARVWLDAAGASAVAKMPYRMITVSPGYNDHALADPRRSGNPYRVVPRHDGKTYQRMLDFAESAAPAPHLVTISTYNEYHENTHIEASARNGDRYIDMTRKFVARIRARAASLGSHP
jgi:glycosyltransferase involved in cell wall biosynthesis